ncbi:MAG: T9SS type A sorting domain-containing protein [Saprospiraceae bacterium]|nr:T9SS type A sorting domain-containing protein [Saprospiraceae bacterium]
MMIPIRYSFPILMGCLLLAGQSARAQCTSDAGSLAINQIFSCVNNPFTVQHSGDQVLDADDIFLFVAYTGNTPNAGSVFATSTDGTFGYLPAFMANSPFKVAAVIGNNAGGTVDWNDPCLSVSASATVTYLEPPALTITPPSITLNCANAQVTLLVSANQQPLAYQWSNGFTTPVVTLQQPGQYSVTVSNQGGCTATATATVQQDIAAPDANAGTDQVMTCAAPTVVLSGSSNTPGAVFTWFGPGGFSSNQISPIVTFPGVYSLTVTNPVNGCTATDNVTVSQNIVLPTVDAGPDQGLPCGGGTVTLQGSASPGSTFSWSSPNGFTSTIQNPVVSQPGVYTIVVTSPSGCTNTDMVTVFAGPVISPQNFAVTPVLCFGMNSGAINLSDLPAGAVLPATFSWSGPNNFTSNQQNISGLPAGSYSLTLADATGCSYYSSPVLLSQPTPITAGFVNPGAACIGANNGIIVIQVTGGTPPYMYSWSNGMTNGPTINNLVPGTYSVTVTDANGCTVFIPAITVPAAPVPSVIATVTNNTCADNGSISLSPPSPNSPQTYAWSGPNGFTGQGSFYTNLSSGIYTVTVTDVLTGCIAIYSYSVQNNLGACGYIEGFVIKDTTENCLTDPGEPGLAGWIVTAESATDVLYGITDSTGKYLIGVPLGDYTLAANLPGNFWLPCPAGLPVSVNAVDDTVPAADILIKKLLDCPALTVSIGTNVLRRCFPNNFYYVDYCNDGTAAATDAYILVTLDPFMSPVSASVPYTNLGNHVLRFNIGDVAVGDCGTFSLQVQISCNAVLGQTHCTEAHIYPDSSCLPPSAQWSGASIDVTSLCDADSVRFFIKNIGLGNMTGPVDYIVVEDAVMLMTGQIQLDANESETLSFPANGSTWHVQVDQVPFNPGFSQPSLSVEGCAPTMSFSTGFVSQFPLNDADPWLDIDCTANIGSFDPNDKQGFPLGYGAAHYIRPGTPIEYMIRFQNTGTDTAFTVRVVDTLSAWLDPATIQTGASSHPYKFDLSGHGIASFLFENILLPDSNVNQAGSNGFLKFSILPRADAPLETIIENNAAIYFDFNDPVITNTTFHRLGVDFLVGTWHPRLPDAEIRVTPNPFSDAAIMKVSGLRSSAPIRLQVFDLQGVVVKEMETTQTIFNLQKGDWPSGIYLFSITQEGRLVGSGKLAVR